MGNHWTRERELRLFFALVMKVPPSQLTFDSPTDRSMFEKILAIQDRLWVNTSRDQTPLIEGYTTQMLVSALRHIVRNAQVPCYSSGVTRDNPLGQEWWDNLYQDLKTKTENDLYYSGHECWKQYSTTTEAYRGHLDYLALSNPERLVVQHIYNQSITAPSSDSNTRKKNKKPAQSRACSRPLSKDLSGITAINRMNFQSNQNPPTPHKGDWSFIKAGSKQDQRTILKNTATVIHNQPAQHTTSDSDLETTSDSDSHSDTPSGLDSGSVTRLSCGTTSAAESDSESVSGYSAGQSGSVASLDDDSLSSYTTTVSDSDNDSVTASISNITGTAIDLADRALTDTEMLNIDSYTCLSSVYDPADP
ncbi:hypothetical protein BP00DRAFT_424067 [Aspergillus indologenus CBS 114.80]|uniref:Uncharacterized protein n=1 Tax=Aspergillus indologenus CBS 114.80 TaxID=1450541 RepID=A0A2V5IX75_9EURO|nr:hypothetical protein BP00DRAFT_424067 [Aspergillus indologenus CBS 114.80]